MLGDLKLLQMASAMARHAAARHEVLARNVANADTPGYRAKDVEPFGDAFARFSGANGQGAADWRVVEARVAGALSPNGNSVSLEDQMMKAVETQQTHEAATAIYKKSLDLVRTALGRRA